MIAFFSLFFSLNHGRRTSMVALALMVALAAGCGPAAVKQHKSDAHAQESSGTDEAPAVLPGQIAFGGEMRLDLSGAVALAVTDGTPPTTQAGTVNAKTALRFGLDGEEEVNLMKITAEGQLLPAFAAKHKDVKIKNTWFRKDIVFLEFAESVLMETKESLEARKRREVIAGIYCNLGYATKEDPTVQCINPLKQPAASSGNTSLSDPIQIDGEGNVFYIGYDSSTYKYNLRHFNIKTRSESVVQEASIQYQYVLNDKGDLFFISGYSGESLGVLKKGETTPERINAKSPMNLVKFPDGLIYFQTMGEGGVKLLMRISEDYTVDESAVVEEPNITIGCQGARPIKLGGAVASLAEGLNCKLGIVQYWPEHRFIEIKSASKFANGTAVRANAYSLNTPSGSVIYDNNGNDTMLIAAEDDEGKPKLIAVNVLTGEETDAIPASMDLQVVNLSAAGNDVYFTAYKASEEWGLVEQKFIVGKIDLQANAVTTSGSPVSISSIEHL